MTNIEPHTAAQTMPESEARAGVYRLLARIWSAELDHPALRSLAAPPLKSLFEQAGGTLPSNSDAHAIEELAVDYCRLFIGPSDHLPPYQSVWQEGQFQGSANASMREFIDLVGFQVGPLANSSMLDHFGLQLEMMGHILAGTGDTNGIEDAQTRSEIARRFFALHLTWPNRLLAAASQRATTPFYRSVIEMTGGFLESERNAIDSPAT